MEAGPPCECHRDSSHCQSLWGDAATKNEAAVTGFFSLPPPFTAVAGTWDDIFLYFGSICCQLLIIPSAGWEEENCMSTSKWATTPAVVISEGEGWFHEQRQKGLKVSVRASCHLLDTKDARERRRAGGGREGYIQNMSARVLRQCTRHSYWASYLVPSAT